MTLEPQAAALAAMRRTDEQLARLEANVEAMAPVVANGDSFTELDIAFHAEVAVASHNWVLIMAREPVNLLYRPTLDYLRVAVPQSGRRILEAHRHILSAIQGNNSQEAETWARKHLKDFQRGYQVAKLDMNSVVRLDRNLLQQ